MRFPTNLSTDGTQVEFAIQQVGEDEGEEEDEAENNARREPYYILQIFQIMLLILRFAGLRQRRLFERLLANGQLSRLFNLAGPGEIDEDDLDPRFLPRRRPLDPDRFPKVPSEKGTELMNSGTFGLNEAHKVLSGNIHKRKRLARRIMDRELASDDFVHQKLNNRLMAQVGFYICSYTDPLIVYCRV
jgi:WD repeat-containing protein 23